jgi:hypothetical protein
VWLSFPWRLNRRIVCGALILASITMLVVAFTALQPDGPVKDGVRILFLLLVAGVIVRAGIRRVEGDGWSLGGRDGDEER